MRVLVTGGAGYIGSHTVLALIKAGHEPVIIDNFANAQPGVIDQLETMTGRDIHCYKADCGDSEAVTAILRQEPCEALIHFAAFKAVGESTGQPLKYYRNNVANFISLLGTVIDNGIDNVVFSSTAAVYGTPPEAAVTETTPPNPESPYGHSKRMDELILQSICQANPALTGTALRYFNVVGADPSGDLGEYGNDKPQNLLPILVEAVAGKRDTLIINGTDYPTGDGTCERDYVHVADLAEAHVAALQRGNRTAQPFAIYNISSGKATSIRQLITTFETVNAVKVPHETGPRRPGDPAAYYAEATKARQELGWQTTRTIEGACRDAWNWQTKHPAGYTTSVTIESPMEVSES